MKRLENLSGLEFFFDFLNVHRTPKYSIFYKLYLPSITFENIIFNPEYSVCVGISKEKPTSFSFINYSHQNTGLFFIHTLEQKQTFQYLSWSPNGQFLSLCYRDTRLNKYLCQYFFLNTEKKALQYISNIPNDLCGYETSSRHNWIGPQSVGFVSSNHCYQIVEFDAEKKSFNSIPMDLFSSCHSNIFHHPHFPNLIFYVTVCCQHYHHCIHVISKPDFTLEHVIYIPGLLINVHVDFYSTSLVFIVAQIPCLQKYDIIYIIKNTNADDFADTCPFQDMSTLRTTMKNEFKFNINDPGIIIFDLQMDTHIWTLLTPRR